MALSLMKSYFDTYTDYLAIVGATSLVYVASKFGRVLLCGLCRTVKRSFAVNVKQFGRWAVITGSTDGIGKSYALQMAEKGMDIVLISRTPQKLEAVAQEILGQYKVAVKTVAADFTKADVYEHIKQELSGLDIGILVNNVGMITYLNRFCDMVDLEQSNRDMLNVNILSCVMMTGIVLPEMVERKRGTIINISSGSGLRPFPFMSLYCATKAFVSYFSQSLNLEYSSQGVTVQVVFPLMVESKSSINLATAQGQSTGLLYPTPDRFVRKAVQTIGREPATIPYWPHELQQFFMDMPSDNILTKIMQYSRNQLHNHLKAQ